MTQNPSSDSISKRIKIKGINREETRRLRKEQKQLDKKQKKDNIKLIRNKASKVSKAFGIIFGILNAIIIAFVITLPLKPIFKQAKKKSRKSYFELLTIV